MDTIINWDKLYTEGRCKNIGIPWSEEEREAIYKMNIPVDYVRMGITTLDAYQKQLQNEASTGKQPLDRWSMDELTTKAEQLGIKFSADVNKSVLVSEIKKRIKSASENAKQQKALNDAYKQHQKEEAEERAKAEKAKEEAKENFRSEQINEVAKAEVEAEAAAGKKTTKEGKNK